MATNFWDELAKGLAGQWTAQKLGPALAFWGGGLLAWAWRFGWAPLINWLVGLNNIAAYVALAVAGLVLLTASSAAASCVGALSWPGVFRDGFGTKKSVGRHWRTSPRSNAAPRSRTSTLGWMLSCPPTRWTRVV
jgi:hypothetical protein